MHQQRNTRKLSLLSLFFSFLPPVYLLSHHLHSSPAFISPVYSSEPFRSSSPPFFISCQMIFETGLIPRPTPPSRQSVSLALFLIVCRVFSRSFICTSVFFLTVFLFSYSSVVTLHVFFYPLLTPLFLLFCPFHPPIRSHCFSLTLSFSYFPFVDLPLFSIFHISV